MLHVRPVAVQSDDAGQLTSWRAQYFGHNPAGEDQFADLEESRQAKSYHVGFYHGDELIGGVRFVPVGEALSLFETLVSVDAPPLSDGKLFEVTRLFIAPEHRGGHNAIKLLKDSFAWLASNSQASGLVALAAADLVPVFRKVGAATLAEQVRGPLKTYVPLYLNLRNQS